MKQYFVYIVTNYSNEVIYVGVTSNLTKRVFEHKNKLIDGFTKKYNVNKLVYYERFEDALSAITREKQLKAGSRQKKLNLITKENPQFDDLYQDII
jgi:putative endonuclease